MQQLGTELFRNDLKKYLPTLNIATTLWIENFFRWLISNQNSNIVVSDCRFPDESEALRKCGLKLYRVIRPKLITPVSENMQHTSEMLQQNIVVDGEIINDGSLEDLYTKVNQLI